ncbi:ABC transporter ATP-binding protein [Alkaliphilus serpentinus]|uniref:ABC transporter ATP-binding protein n=1 Tax=Alkaliphilus serpentinus TaxID=1482731 RepID=A0A833HQ58_9FIRM|nr:ABC transporter ATP-binding protein [Alkaliphilus serpentinus]KAB3531507.1 ABC transporter ATP-binding protein [Alkaliphilus serpentinus]
MSYIQFDNVIRRYSHNIAVDQISFGIERGEVFGLLGPNGAGKSTTIKMLAGLLKPNSGEIFIDGISVIKNPIEAKKKLGLVPQDIAIYTNLSAIENVTFFGSLYGLKGSELKEKVQEALSFTGLTEKAKEKPKKFSGGMKRRLNIACALVHNPEIIIMDEPTVGIDPQSRNHILNSIMELNNRGTTVIYTSHYMEEVEAICNRIGIIDEGRLIALGSKQQLKQKASTKEKILVEAHDYNDRALRNIKELPGVIHVDSKEGLIEIIAEEPQERLQDIIFMLVKDEGKLKNISIKEINLENVFLELTGRNLRD